MEKEITQSLACPSCSKYVDAEWKSTNSYGHTWSFACQNCEASGLVVLNFGKYA